MASNPRGKTAEGVRVAVAKGYFVDAAGHVFNPQGRPLKPWFTSDGYLRVSIRVGYDRRKVHVHRIAAYQQYGEEALRADLDCRHLNGNKLDNRPVNIALGTRSENMLDRPADVRREHALKAARVKRKLSQDGVAQFWQLRRQGMGLKTLAKTLGISLSTASYILTGKMYCDWRPADADSFGSDHMREKAARLALEESHDD